MRLGDVRTFAHVYADDKALALKPLEEAAEVAEAWKAWQKQLKSKKNASARRQDLEDEIADVIQASCNLAAALGIVSLEPALRRCENRNVKRGRYN